MTEWELFLKAFIQDGGYNVVIMGLFATIVIAVFGLLFGFIIGSIIAVIKVITPYKLIIKILQKICDL